jgi:hypothetical protein
MAKAVKKKATTIDTKEFKSSKEASVIFHNIIKASVTVGLNTPKPKKKKSI